MDNHQLKHCLEILLGTRADIVVISSKSINQFKVRAPVTLLVVHISPSYNNSIGHFICILLRSRNNLLIAEYFDSLGRSIDYYLTNFKIPINFNWSRKIQNPESNLCGIYILYFTYVRFNQYCSCFLPTLSQSLFKNTFSTNMLKNDTKMLIFYKRLLSQSLPVRSIASSDEIVSCVSNCV